MFLGYFLEWVWGRWSNVAPNFSGFVTSAPIAEILLAQFLLGRNIWLADIYHFLLGGNIWLADI
jgi:hypothetical protein